MDGLIYNNFIEIMKEEFDKRLIGIEDYNNDIVRFYLSYPHEQEPIRFGICSIPFVITEPTDKPYTLDGYIKTDKIEYLCNGKIKHRYK